MPQQTSSQAIALKRNLCLSMLLLWLAGCAWQDLKQTDADKKPTILAPAPRPAFNPQNQMTRWQVGSCAHQKKPQPLWSVMLTKKPDLYIGTGDNVYASHPDDKPIGEAYRLQALVPEFALYRQQVPMLATWDDHDFGVNDGGAGNPERDEAQKLFESFFPEMDELIPPGQTGVYTSVMLGPVQVIFLDTRSFRSPLVKNTEPNRKPLDIYAPNTDPTATVLGESQWSWLEAELKKPARVRVIVSSIQVLPDQHGFEKWSNFPLEKKRLESLVRKNSKEKLVLFLSGDRHHGEISVREFKGKNRQTWVEMTASGINRTSTLVGEQNQFRLDNKLLQVENFGELNWDFAKGQVRVSLCAPDLNAKDSSGCARGQISRTFSF